MRKSVLISTLLLATAIAAPVRAQDVVREVIVAPVPERQRTVTEYDRYGLDRYVGRTLFGLGKANLGVVNTADPYTGIITVSGRYGEYALISASMLTHDGLTLSAPTLTAGDIKVASDANLAHPGAILSSPHVIVVEPPLG